MSRLIFAICVCLTALSFAQDLKEPPNYGPYLKSTNGWERLVYVSPLGSSVGAFSGVTLIYHGGKSLVQISEHRPIFYFEKMPTARNMVIVQFDEKQDHREVKVIRSHIVSAKGGPDKKHLIDKTVQDVNNHLISITPNQDLLSGEYLLTESGGYGGYDFGIR